MGWHERTNVVWTYWKSIRPPVKPPFSKVALASLMRWFYNECTRLGIDPEEIDVVGVLSTRESYDENKARLAAEIGIRAAPPPPVVVPPEVPKPPPRVPRVPPTLEGVAVCPYCHRPLTRVEKLPAVPIYRRVGYEEEVRERMKGMPEWEISREVAREYDRRMREGIPLERELLWPTEVTIPPGYLYFHCSTAGCPGYCKYHEIRDLRRREIGGREEFIAHVRRIAERAIPRPPRPPVAVPRVPFVEYVPALRKPFEVPFADRDAFYRWLAETPDATRLFELSDDEQKERLYRNFVYFIKERRPP